MDLESFLVSLYVLVNEWWLESRPPAPHGPGRPLLSESEVLTLAILAQWPRFRSERDFFRFAETYLRGISQTCSLKASSTGAPVRSSPNCGRCSGIWPKRCASHPRSTTC
jgi:hypothetical protein